MKLYWVLVATAILSMGEKLGAADFPKEVNVRVLDDKGKAVSGAHIGVVAYFAQTSKMPSLLQNPPDAEGWRYYALETSNHEGKARVKFDFGLKHVVVRHVGKQLIGIAEIAPDQSANEVVVNLQPACKISGTVSAKALEDRHRALKYPHVTLWTSRGPGNAISVWSATPAFHFYAPPGTYELEVDCGETHGATRSVVIKPGMRDLNVGTIDVIPTKHILLVGQPAPELTDVIAWKNTSPLKLSDLKGKVVLLEFWGHWCAPCVGRRMAELFALHDKYHGKGLVIIAVHAGAGEGIDTIAKLDEKLVSVKKSAWKGRDIPFPVALTRERKVPFGEQVKGRALCQIAADYGILAYPTGIVIDRQGRVVDWDHDDEVIERAILDKDTGSGRVNGK